MKKITILSTILLSLFLVGCSSTSKDIETTNTSDGKVIATIYTSDFDTESLVDKKVNVNELTANSVFNELKNINVIPKDTKLKSFSTYSKNNQTIGVIDFSEDFYSFNLGSSGEVLMLNSIAKTYIENFNLDKFKILVDGKEYESGHILFEKDDYFTLDSID